MATRDNLPIIRAARTGTATAQLTLGARYFFGKSGLPQSTGTAFYWLERAARQGLEEACLMIGRHVSYDMLAGMSRPYEAAPWYERAFDAGVFRAGLVFARLVLENARQFGATSKHKALAVLKVLADKDDHDAQWLLAQHLHTSDPADHELVVKAASAGIEGAQYALLEKTWSAGQVDTYVQTAMPMADSLLTRHHAVLAKAGGEPPATTAPLLTLTPQELQLSLRLAHALLQGAQATPQLQQLLELGALSGAPQARLQLGLFHARLDSEGQRVLAEHGLANYRRAVAWLLVAADDGVAAAWHALSRVYARSEFSQRDLPTAKRYLERAADMGLPRAQLELAQHAWRNRRDSAGHDVAALYWWLKAARQGERQAREALQDFIAQRERGAWAQEALAQAGCRARKANPFLCTRLDLARVFGLSRPEALLLDVRHADHGHCLDIDISALHGKSRRRLVLVEGMEQRMLLNTAQRLFGDVDCSYAGPEGNYRQRQYKLKALLTSQENQR